MYKKIVGLLFLFSLLWALPAFGAVQSFRVNYDNTIDRNVPDQYLECSGSNYVGMRQGNLYRYLAKVDLDNLTVPAAQIVKATFKISGDNFSGDKDYTIHKITSDWNKFSVNWNSQPTVDVAGFSPTVNPPIYVRMRFDLTDLVKGWATDPASNKGLLLQKTGDELLLADAFGDFNCNDYSSQTGLEQSPVLEIETCSADEWTCSDYSSCSNGTQTRTCNKTLDCQGVDTPAPALSRDCVVAAPENTPVVSQTFRMSYDNVINDAEPAVNSACQTYGDIGSWSAYSGSTHRYLTKTDVSGFQASVARITKATFKMSPISSTWDDDLNYVVKKITSSWSPLSVNWGNQPSLDAASVSLTPNHGLSFDVTDMVKDWLANPASNNGILVKKAIEDITLPSHKGSFACADYSATAVTLTIDTCAGDGWTCSDYTTCTAAGSQTRTCTKTFDCPDVDTPSPATTQSCTPPVTCTADTWECGDWSICGANGIQSRTCNKTFDCSIANTPSPTTQQTCLPPIVLVPLPPVVPPVVLPVTPAPTPETPPVVAPAPVPVPDDIFDVNIIKSTVQVVCEQGNVRIYGSGTVIKSDGTILTNRHVVEGEGGAFAPKCYVGFTSDPNEDPVFTDMATPIAVSTDEDIAKLRIANASQTFYDWVDISHSSVNSSRFGGKIKILGYPAIGGANLTFSSGDFSGFGSKSEGLNNYIKTTAVIEHGNSGGGTYSDSGSFVGIPTFVRKGTLNVLGFILSVNKINSWLSTSKENIKFSKSATALSLNTVAYLENITDLTPPDLSNVHVVVNKKITKQPKFTVTGVEDADNNVAGYYYYFGTNSRANPLAKGKFSRSATYTPVALKSYGTYYFIFVAKDSKGNISESYTTAYSYVKAKK